jgi:hypothetical protein
MVNKTGLAAPKNIMTGFYVESRMRRDLPVFAVALRQLNFSTLALGLTDAPIDYLVLRRSGRFYRSFI